jgi:hypothetical protein
MGFFTSAAEEQQKIEQILSQFPGPVTLYPSRSRLALMAFGSLLFVAISIWAIRTSSGDWEIFLAWASTIFFGLCLVVFCLQLLLPGSSSLTLERDQFTTAGFFRSSTHSWRDVRDFSVWQFRNNKMVLFDSRAETSPLKGLNTALSGKNSGLPDTYGFKADALVELMTRWRERALQG